MKIDTVIFDLGNVLVRWSPTILYDKIFTDKSERDHFLNNIATMDWHSEQDAGRSPQEATELLVKEHPGWAHPIRAFYARWKEMFAGPIEGSVEILKELKEKGYKVYALSNWNAELFNDTLDDFPFLHWFDDKVISGEVRLKKPDAAIFQLAFERFKIQPQQAAFIDDSEANIKTAQSLGLHSILFKSPEALRKELQTLNLLSMALNITTIIFDLGGVLIDWNPAYVFDTLIPDEEKRKHFFENICTHEWNEEQDAGRTIKEANEVLIAKHPEWKEHIEAYYGRWEEMLGGPIEETVEIFRQLKGSGKYKFYALTNWSAELFPIALGKYDFLHWFDGRLVSGEEKMRKPSPEFYQLLLDRFNIRKEEALFIDDNLRNAEAAQAVGLETIRFTSPAQLRDELKTRGIL